MYGALTTAAIPAPVWDGFDIGPVTIHAYALCIVAGMVAALWLAARRWKARGGPEGSVIDISIWAIIFGLVGARLYHVVSSPDAYFGPNFDGTGDLTKIWRVWEGGLGIWGAVALGAVGAWIACRRYGFKISAYADVVAPGVLLAQAIGRLGNYFNQELFGGPTTAPWGLQVSADHPNFPAGALEGTLFHPTFAYEMLWNLLGVALLLLIDRRLHLRRGMMLWSYVAWYTAGRTWIEMLRIDEAEMITLFGTTQRLNVWTSLLMLLVAIGFLIYLGLTRPKTAEAKAEADSVWRAGHEPVEESETGTEIETETGTETETATDSMTESETGSATAVGAANPAEPADPAIDGAKVNAAETKKVADPVEKSD
ncbi:prolipoprotein diacylglyceryl transferase [Citricoccus nitrophenolicus]|uniref:Phosphatidylglycerol--prolipoprotein diacylglyceryl transferase n=1 Tax=Citricoccus muralis TaxID=169134 RepID=A0A3D9LCV1_9MICC|nr:prolipoprotein diacylglyceryl transferase [Citricoccus muralis]REE03013.1 prolipoprotein diacylglyceryl transferase [Citricoccus muralis]